MIYNFYKSFLKLKTLNCSQFYIVGTDTGHFEEFGVILDTTFRSVIFIVWANS